MKNKKNKSFLQKIKIKTISFCNIEFSNIKSFLNTYNCIFKDFYIKKRNSFLNLSNLNNPPVFLNKNYEIIADKPLNLKGEEELRFGHGRIANVICDLFNSTKPPFTLGLFGSWGVGKSTIINRIVNNFKGTKIRTVFFDVWKYDDDSLRRQLLIKLDGELNLKLKYRKKLNQTLTVSRIDWVLLLISLFFNIIILGIVIVSLFLIFNSFREKTAVDLKDSISKYFSKDLILGGILALIFSILKSFTEIKTNNIQIQKTDTSEGFEDCFTKITNKLNSDEKLLVIIDNLDRTTNDKSLALLSDIKTFLNKDGEESKALFLIACDQNAVMQQIKKGGFDDPDEYLRKFFNASISVPKYLGEELDDYTVELLKETQIPEFIKNNNLAWLITYVFKNNPREIKQFINTLTVNYLLAEEMENKKDITQKGIITNNVDSLAKILVIKLKFNEEYKKLEELVINESLDWNDINGDPSKLYRTYETDDGLETETNEEFIKFVKQTEFIDIKNLLIFIRLRQSDQEKIIPNLNLFFSNVEYGDEKLAEKIIKKIDIKKFKDLDTALKSEIKRIGSSRGSSFANLVYSILLNFKEKTKKLNKFTNEVALSFPNATLIRIHIKKLKPSLIFNYIFPYLKNEFLRKRLVTIYSSVLNGDPNKWQVPITDDCVVDLIQTICKNSNYFIKTEYKIKENLANYWANPITISTLVNNNGYDFMTNSLADNYIQKLDTKNLEEKDLNLKLLCLNNLIIGTDMTIKSGFIYYFQIISNETEITLSDTIQKEILMDKLFEYIYKYKDKLDFVNESDPRLINDITSQLIPWFNNSTEERNKFRSVKIFDHLIISNNNQLDTLKSLINKFWTNVTYDFVQKISDNDKKHFFESYHDAIIDGIKNNVQLLDVWFEKLSNEDVESIVIFNLDRNYQVDMLGNRWDKISSRIKQVVQIKDKILNNLDSFNDNLKRKMIAYCESDNFFDDQSHNSILFDYLLRNVATQIKLVEIFGRRHYFNRQQKIQLGLISQPTNV
jgi:hypothetical protein